MGSKITQLTENTTRDLNDLIEMVDDPVGTPLNQRMKFVNLTGLIVNAQTGTSYTYLTGDYGKLVTHTNASPIAGTLPQSGSNFPANWFMLVQNRGAGVLTITPTTSTIDGAATLVLNQNEGAIVVSDGTNYFTLRGKATGAAGVGDVVGPGSATDNALVRFDGTTGKLIQNSTVSLDDTGAITVPEMAAPSTPASGKVSLYAKSDGLLYSKDDAGAETLVSGGSASTGFAGGEFDKYKLTAMQAQSNGTTLTLIGFAGPASPSAGGGSSNQNDADGHWIRRTTGATSGNQAGENANSAALVYMGHLPQCIAKIKTHTSIAGCRIWVGLFSSTPVGSDDPTLNGLGFRYATAVDGTAFWRTWSNDNSGGGTATTTSQSIATSTMYHLAIKVISSSSVEFYISTDNGVTYTLVATHTTDLPADSSNLNFEAKIQTTENVDKGIYFSWMHIRSR